MSILPPVRIDYRNAVTRYPLSYGGTLGRIRIRLQCAAKRLGKRFRILNLHLDTYNRTKSPYMGDQPIPRKRGDKYLGVTFGTKTTFETHVKVRNKTVANSIH